ncbi:uncharacterized protein LOC106079343 [Biomphalaria glabrata]|uniref:Uncharacterized protein LOC106079343 n=1 Tax=Biomphalaria glabrata TaxID=6526 RepID=A0A9U8ENI2_BIOGL|nr:uncharacterized protein LOC106079343 [Biomphalaria glabrata]XP_055901490.1 uncharacterized protein LOC106079343 [Biomphalaria glabrata]
MTSTQTTRNVRTSTSINTTAPLTTVTHSSTNNSTSQVNSSDDGAIAGGCIAALVVVALIIIGSILFYRRRKLQSETNKHHSLNSEPHLDNDQYLNVDLPDITQPSLPPRDIQAAYLNTLVLDTSLPNTEFNLSHINQSSTLTNNIDKENKAIEQLITVEANTQSEKPEFYLDDNTTNDAYTSLRSQTGECVNPYNTLQEFEDTPQETAKKPSNNIPIKGSDISVISLPELEKTIHSFLEKKHLKSEEMKSAYLNCASNGVKQDTNGVKQDTNGAKHDIYQNSPQKRKTHLKARKDKKNKKNFNKGKNDRHDQVYSNH